MSEEFFGQGGLLILPVPNLCLGTPFVPATPLPRKESRWEKEATELPGQARSQVQLGNEGAKTGTSDLIYLSRHTVTPARAIVPLTGENPEEWQFQTRAVKSDQEIGKPSPLVSTIVRS